MPQVVAADVVGDGVDGAMNPLVQVLGRLARDNVEEGDDAPRPFAA